MIIGVDMDEVLSQTIEAVLDHHHTINNKHITVDQITDYYRWQLPELNTEFEEAIEVLDTTIQNQSALPVVGAYQNLQSLKDQGHKLVVITARPKVFFDSTNRWIQAHFEGMFDEVYFAAYHSDDKIPKRQICKNLGVQLMIEDNYHYAMDLIDHDISTVLLNKPWNIHYSDPEQGLYRIDHRDQICDTVANIS